MWVNLYYFMNNIHVTGFAKRGLPHTFNSLTLLIHNFRLVKAIDLKFDLQEVPTQVNGWQKFQLYMSFDNKDMVLQVHEIG